MAGAPRTLLLLCLAAAVVACKADRSDSDPDAPCCDSTPESGDTGGPPGDFSGVQRVILITVDTLRADRYGGEHMPFLAGLEAEGVLWTGAWAQSWTYAGTGSQITGRNPSTWGRDSYDSSGSGLPVLSEDVPTAAGMLKEQGWATAYWTSNEVAMTTGLDRDYDSAILMGVDDGTWRVDLSTWLGDTADQPQFVHLHLNDSHDPYNAWGEDCAADQELLDFDACPYDLLTGSEQGVQAAATDVIAGTFGEWSPEFDECAALVTSLYDCEVEGLDENIQKLFGRLDEDGLLTDTLIVISPDHGEGLFDPNPNHGFDMRTPVTRSRVLFWAPGRLEPDVVDTPVALEDILPSINALLDLGLDTSEMTGMPYWESPADRVVTGYNIAAPEGSAATETHYAADATWHYIRSSAGVEELYAWQDDPLENTNLIGIEPVPADLQDAVDAQALRTAEYLE